MSYVTLEDSNFNVAEKVNVLFKDAMGFPSTLESKPWFQETTIKYNNYIVEEKIFLDEIPSNPNFNVTINPSNVGLSNSNFSAGGEIKEDSTGTIRYYKRLKLTSISGSNNNSYYLLDSAGNNVLADGLQFNTKWSGSGTKPYPYELTSQSAINTDSTAPEIILQNSSGGNWFYDMKSGVIFFPDYSSSIVNNTTNPPVFSFYKYIGRKGISELIKISSSQPSNPVTNQILLNTYSKKLQLWNGSSWDDYGAGSTFTQGTGITINSSNVISINQVASLNLTNLSSTTQGTTDNSTNVATTAFVQTAVSNLIDSAPSTLDTLNELAAALGDDANFSTTIVSNLATKLPSSDFTSHPSYNITSNDITNWNTVNVNSDWDATSGDAEILNKPQTIGGIVLSGTSVDLPGVNQTGNQNTTGNAATATKLQFARTLGGVSFDGTADINLPGVNEIGDQDTTGNAATATQLQSARTIQISGDTTADSTAFNGTTNITLLSTLSNTGVSASTYGSATTVPVITVDSKGRITDARNQALSQIITQVQTVAGPSYLGGDYGLGGLHLASFGTLTLVQPGAAAIREVVQTGSLTQLSVTGALNLGEDNGVSHINILFDDHNSGPVFDTAIFIGKTNHLPNGENAAPTHMPGEAYGIQFQSNSDGAFYGIENYGNNQYRPIIKWGDDPGDTPFTIKSHSGTGGSGFDEPHETQFRTNGDLVCMNGNVETNGYFKGMSNTVCKIHYIPYTAAETSNASGNNFQNVVTKPFTKTVGTKLVIETNFEYSINGHGSDSFESRIKMYYGVFNSSDPTQVASFGGDQVELRFTGNSGGGHRSNGLNDCVLISSGSSTVNYSGTISCRLEIRRVTADDTVTVRQGYFKVTELWD